VLLIIFGAIVGWIASTLVGRSSKMGCGANREKATCVNRASGFRIAKGGEMWWYGMRMGGSTTRLSTEALESCFRRVICKGGNEGKPPALAVQVASWVLPKERIEKLPATRLSSHAWTR
jgi:hypothetical protein